MIVDPKNGESQAIGYGYEEETWEAKVAWFRSLSMVERLKHLDAMYRLAVGLNPKLREGSDAGYASASFRILELAPG